MLYTLNHNYFQENLVTRQDISDNKYAITFE